MTLDREGLDSVDAIMQTCCFYFPHDDPQDVNVI